MAKPAMTAIQRALIYRRDGITRLVYVVAMATTMGAWAWILFEGLEWVLGA